MVVPLGPLAGGTAEQLVVPLVHQEVRGSLDEGSPTHQINSNHQSQKSVLQGQEEAVDPTGRLRFKKTDGE